MPLWYIAAKRVFRADAATALRQINDRLADVTVDAPAVAADEAIATLSRRGQKNVRNYFRFLAEHPFTRGDGEVADKDGRICQIKCHDRVVITYWADHASCKVNITAVEYL